MNRIIASNVTKGYGYISSTREAGIISYRITAKIR